MRVRPHKKSCPDWALTKNRARTGRSQKIAPGLEASNQVRDVKPGPERSEGPAFSHVRNVSPDLSEVRVQRLTKLEMSSPDLNEVRVQRLTSAVSVSANPSEVRVRPHKRSGANLKRQTWDGMFSANPSEVRVHCSLPLWHTLSNHAKRQPQAAIETAIEAEKSRVRRGMRSEG